MQFFRAARFSVERFMEDERYQQAYVGALTGANPILRSSMLCGQLNAQLGHCYAQHGRDSEQCAEALVNTLACTASVFAPPEFERWRQCVSGEGEGGVPADGCVDEMQAALEASERNYNRFVADAPMTHDAATVDAIRRCGFPGGPDDDEVTMNRTIDCVAPVLCPGPLASFMECVEKHAGNYTDSACLRLGESFARCFGAGMAEAALRAELEN